MGNISIFNATLYTTEGKINISKTFSFKIISFFLGTKGLLMSKMPSLVLSVNIEKKSVNPIRKSGGRRANKTFLNPSFQTKRNKTSNNKKSRIPNNLRDKIPLGSCSLSLHRMRSTLSTVLLFSIFHRPFPPSKTLLLSSEFSLDILTRS